MQPQLTTPEGTMIPLTEEVYATIVEFLKNDADNVEPAASIDELESEFSSLFADSPSTSDLLAEHADELARENGKLDRF